MVKTHTAARARIQMWTFYSTILPYLKTCTVFMKTIHVCCKVFLKWSFRHIFVICIGKFYPVCTMSVEYYYCPIGNVDKTVKIHPFLNRVVKYYTCTHFYFIFCCRFYHTSYLVTTLKKSLQDHRQLEKVQLWTGHRQVIFFFIQADSSIQTIEVDGETPPPGHCILTVGWKKQKFSNISNNQLLSNRDGFTLRNFDPSMASLTFFLQFS